ncbi:alpha/beta hydrolase [Flavobacterium enshiense]|uniref:alpha/beta fold hydrolase n=1 Tax=Flavobacterium enshiense TaxID=1341165 RepID=UPI00345CA4EE
MTTITNTETLNDVNADTAPNQYVEVNGDQIAYRSFGKGSPIVLANRMRGTLDTWDPLFLNEMAKSHTVITFDYPGTGYSTGTLPNDMSIVADYVKKFTAALKIEKFAMLGWSWGGFVTQTTLLEYPDNVTHGFLVGTAPPGIKDAMPIEQIWVDRAIKPVNDLEDEEILFFEPASEFSKKMARLSRERIYARGDVDSKIPSTMDIFELFFEGHNKFKEDLNRREQLTKTKTPLLIICGDHDPSVPAEHWYALSGKFENAQIVVYPKSGHGPQHQYPELSANYIKDFIKFTSK